MNKQNCLFLGLGDIGEKIVEELVKTIKDKDIDFENYIAYLTIDDDAKLTTYVKEKTNNIDLNISKLEKDIDKSCYRKNYKHFQEKKGEISETIKVIRKELKSLGKINIESPKVIIISTIFDVIGSSLLFVILEILQELKYIENVEILKPDILLLYPDLFKEFASNKDMQMRTYACIQELEFLFREPNILCTEGGESPFDSVFLFSGKNKVNSYEKLIPLISDYFYYFITSDIRDDNAEQKRNENVDGRPKFLNSIGMSKLIYPENMIRKGLRDYFYNKLIVSKILNLEEQTDVATVIFDDVKTFIDLPEEKNSFYTLSDIEDLLKIDINGETILSSDKFNFNIPDPGFENNDRKTDFWRSLLFLNEAEKRSDMNLWVNNFDTSILKEIDARGEKYVTDSNNDSIAKLSIRNDKLTNDLKVQLENKVDSLIDDRNKGVYYTSIFLDILQNNKNNEYYKGDIGHIEDFFLKNKEKPLQFFKNTLEIDTKELENNIKKLINVEVEIIKKEKILDKFNKKGKDEIEKTPEVEKLFNDTEEELKKLKKDEEEIKDKIRALELTIYPDPKDSDYILDEYDRIVEIDKDVLEERFNEIQVQCEENLKDYEENIEIKKKSLKKIFTFSPLMLILLFTAIGYLLISVLKKYTLVEMLTSNIGFFMGTVFFIGLPIFLGIKLYKNRISILEDLKILNNSIMEKKIILRKGIELYNIKAEKRFYIKLYSYMSLWYKQFLNNISVRTKQLEEFIETINILSKNSIDDYNNIKFTQNHFAKSVFKKEDLQVMIEKKRKEILSQFFKKDTNLSFHFKEFSKTNELNVFKSEIDNEIENLFKMNLKDQTVDKFLEGEDLDFEKHTLEFKKYSDPVITLKYNESENLVKTYFFGTAYDNSFYSKKFENIHSKRLNMFRTGKNEIMLINILYGFPGFYVSHSKKADILLQESENHESYYVNKKWKKKLRRLFSLESLIGDEKNENRVLICLGRALGLIKEEDRGLIFKRKNIGTYEAAVEHISNVLGEDVKEDLKEKIDKIKNKHKIEEVIEEVKEYRKKNKKELDDIDLKIIDRFMDEIDSDF